MQTLPEAHSRDSHKLQRIATALRLVGWASFWLELVLAAASGLVLAFAISGRNFTQLSAPSPGGGVAQGVTPSLGIGIFWATCGLAVLLFNLYLAFRYTRFARRLRNSNPTVPPKKADVMQVLRLGVIVGLVGLAVSILGGGASLGMLLSKSISQPQGVAIYDPSRIIRSVDVFVAMANMNGIAGHFVATIAALGLHSGIDRA